MMRPAAGQAGAEAQSDSDSNEPNGWLGRQRLLPDSGSLTPFARRWRCFLLAFTAADRPAIHIYIYVAYM